MPRSLADGHIRLTMCTESPADPAAPTKAELDAGIHVGARILATDFSWTATDSDTNTSEPDLTTTDNAPTLGSSNYNLGITVFLEFGEESTADEVFQATKEKGTKLWMYARETNKLAIEDWVEGDPIFLGGQVQTDSPQRPNDRGGWIKRRVPLLARRMHQNIAVATQ